MANILPEPPPKTTTNPTRYNTPHNLPPDFNEEYVLRVHKILSGRNCTLAPNDLWHVLARQIYDGVVDIVTREYTTKENGITVKKSYKTVAYVGE